MSAADAQHVVVAPLDAELRPFLREIAGRRERALPDGAIFRGRWAERDVVAAVIGDGAGRAARGLEELITRYRPRRLLLIGVAGGLSPELSVAELVRASRVVEMPPQGEPSGWSVPGGGDGTIVAGDRILASSEEKAALWHRLGEPSKAVVDLESAAFARLADHVGAVWTVVRAVTDPQGEDLPLDLVAASDDGGHVVRGRVVRQLLARPAALGQVQRLRRRLRLCAEALASAAQGWIEEAD